ncbi:hypothetical protein V2G26_016432 [Clonostachys chloroleuca]
MRVMQSTDGACHQAHTNMHFMGSGQQECAGPPNRLKDGLLSPPQGLSLQKECLPARPGRSQGEGGGGTERQTNPLKPNKPTTPLTGWCQCVQSLELLSHMGLLDFD